MYTKVLGPYGLDKRYTKGLDILQVLQSNNLCVVNTFFGSTTHVTYVDPNDNSHALDYVVMNQSDLTKVISWTMVDV
jgi:hypothetical protein